MSDSTIGLINSGSKDSRPVLYCSVSYCIVLQRRILLQSRQQGLKFLTTTELASYMTLMSSSPIVLNLSGQIEGENTRREGQTQNLGSGQTESSLGPYPETMVCLDFNQQVNVQEMLRKICKQIEMTKTYYLL